MTSPASPRGLSTALLLKSLLFTVLVPGTVSVLVPYWILRSRQQLQLEALGPLQVLGILAMALGAAGYLWCAWDFALGGRGTPAPIDPPKTVVARGLYRFVRNPMYVSVGLVLLGESVFFQSIALLGYALLFGTATWLFVALYEEPMLKRKFGKKYEEYCQTVPRWIPRLPARSPK